MIKIGQFFDIMEPKPPTPPLAAPKASETKETIPATAPQKSKAVKSTKSSPGDAVPETPKASTPEAYADAKTPETTETEETKVTTLDTSPQTYYQAIGWLRGRLIHKEERFHLEVRDKAFPLYMARRLLSVAKNHLNQMIWVKCYPQSKGEGLSFRAVWMGLEQHEENGEAGIFVLRGVWQFIPQCRRPVFSIYRNQLKDYENRPNNQHLPLIWADQPPYRFRKDSEEKPKFYQILARLIPQRDCFGFVSQIADPIDKTPRRVKKTPPGAEGKDGKGSPKEFQGGKSKTEKLDSKTPGKAKSSETETLPVNPEGQTPPESVVIETLSPELASATVTPTVAPETTQEAQSETVSPTPKEVKKETKSETVSSVSTVTASPTTTELEPKSSGEMIAETVESPTEVTPEDAPKTGKKIRLVPRSKKAEVPAASAHPVTEPEAVVDPAPSEETPKKTRAKTTKTKKSEVIEPVTEMTTEATPKKTRAKTTKTPKAETGESEA